MTGMVGAVISAGNPHVYREILTEAPGPEDIRRCWERAIRMAEVIGWIRRFGPGRILINSDHIPYRPYDVFAVPRLIREMRRAGLALDVIRRAVFDNANALYGLGL